MRSLSLLAQGRGLLCVALLLVSPFAWSLGYFPLQGLFGGDSPTGFRVDDTGSILIAMGDGFAYREDPLHGASLLGKLFKRHWLDGCCNLESIGVGRSGDVFIADAHRASVYRITAAGTVTTLAVRPAAGLSASDAAGARPVFDWLTGIAVDAADNIYVSEYAGNAILRINPHGHVELFAGALGKPGNADGAGGAARFNGPKGLAMDSAGNLYVADTGNNAIRKIDTSGMVTTIPVGKDRGADSPPLQAEQLAVGPDDTLYALGQSQSLHRITPAGADTVVRITGPGVLNARQVTPLACNGISVDKNGVVYVLQSYAHRIYRLGPDGRVTVVADVHRDGYLDWVPSDQ